MNKNIIPVEEMIKRIARMIYEPKSISDDTWAIQQLFEYMILPPEVEIYSLEDMEEKIEDWFKKNTLKVTISDFSFYRHFNDAYLKSQSKDK